MKNKILILLITITIGLASCKKFLDVQPKTSLAEESLFTTEVGFKQALNGVYSQLAGRNLYGDKLTMGFVSALAQNYNITATGTDLVDVVKLSYTSTEVQTHVDAIWTSGYAAIAGANKIIINADKNKSLLSDTAYATVRGEALAIRALVHFDLVRLFGKEYGANATSKAIPYKKDITQNASIPNTLAEVIDFALADLVEAENLMKNLDPLVAFDLRTRRSKLNYFAIKALQARILLYKGDKVGAAAAATTVVNSTKYTWVTQSEASANGTAITNARDRLYFNEQVFMLRSRELAGWTETYFHSGGVNAAANKLTRSAANFATLYESSTTDWRYLYRFDIENTLPFPSKFWQNSSTQLLETRRDQLVPIIRLAEMYYILAETAPTVADGIAYLNIVRQNRALAALVPTTPANLTAEITKEYQKEFYAEGQLLFYYKRMKTTPMQFRTGTVTAAMYVLPIPNSELETNPTYN